MVTATTLRSPYETRVLLVRDALQANSTLDETAAGDLAVHVLEALNAIPEKIR
ncbi:hypothetical protein BH10ACT9_BH10ACT9_27410 [soil metagenome]|jgi:Family of unknown function (DUF6307)